MKTLLTVDTWLPIFSGFYGTLWDSYNDADREIENINEERKKKNLPPVERDAIEWDYDGYRRAVVKGITEAVGDKLKADGLISDYKLQKLNSPREYNFANDSIYVSFSLNDANKKAIAKYLAENEAAFTKYLKDHYTSYDGFCSSYSNRVSDWLLDVDSVLAHGHQAGAVLNFILLNEDKGLEMEIYENMHGNGVFLSAKNWTALTGGK
jgi:hypothetical protein